MSERVLPVLLVILVAGCASPGPGEDAAADAPDVAASAPESETIVVEYADTLAAGYTDPVDGSRHKVGMSAEGGSPFTLKDGHRVARMTAYWNATTPAYGSLYVYLYDATERVAEAEGRSPLVVADATKIGPGEYALGATPDDGSVSTGETVTFVIEIAPVR